MQRMVQKYRSILWRRAGPGCSALRPFKGLLEARTSSVPKCWKPAAGVSGQNAFRNTSLIFTLQSPCRLKALHLKPQLTDYQGTPSTFLQKQALTGESTQLPSCGIHSTRQKHLHLSFQSCRRLCGQGPCARSSVLMTSEKETRWYTVAFLKKFR